MKVLLLLPAFIYISIAFTNIDLLSKTETINIYWLYDLNIPILLFSVIFFILYVVVIWVFLNFSDLFSVYKKNKSDKEILELKSKLQDWQSELIDSINNNFKQILEETKKENEVLLLKHKKENEKILSNLEYDIESIKEKIDKVNVKI